MCRFATTELPPRVSSAASGRRWIAEVLTRWELEDLIDTAILLTSELVTNAVIHTNTVPSVSAAVAEGVLEIGVRDSGLHPAPLPSSTSLTEPPIDDEALLAETGRGLLLLDRLVEEWGTTPLRPGNAVWFRLNAPRWAYEPDCPCRSESIDRVQLASGHHAHPLPGIWDSPPTLPRH